MRLSFLAPLVLATFAVVYASQTKQREGLSSYRQESSSDDEHESNTTYSMGFVKRSGIKLYYWILYGETYHIPYIIRIYNGLGHDNFKTLYCIDKVGKSSTINPVSSNDDNEEVVYYNNILESLVTYLGRSDCFMKPKAVGAILRAILALSIVAVNVGAVVVLCLFFVNRMKRAKTADEEGSAENGHVTDAGTGGSAPASSQEGKADAHAGNSRSSPQVGNTYKN